MKVKITPLKLAAFIIFVFGIFLRLWNLNKAPISLFGDEIDSGLQAYSILTTGKDYLGNNLPVIFHSFSEYRLPMQLYMSVPFIKLFGLSEYGVRGASVLMGLVSILGLYFLAKELFGKRIAQFSALFLLFSPWHFLFSRQANDSGFALPFLLFGTLFFIKGLKKYKFLVYSSTIFALGLYSYATFTLFAPLFVIVLLSIFYKDLRRYPLKKLIFVGLIGFVVAFPYLYETFKGTTTHRVSVISLLTEEEIEQKVVEGRRWDKGFFGKLFYNKYTIITNEFLGNYSKALSPNFLFFSGDPNPRHSAGQVGLMYSFEVVTVLFGMFALAKTLKGKNIRVGLLIFLWLLLAPIPSSITEGGGTHAARLILMLPPMVLLSAYGVTNILGSRSKYLKYFILMSLSLLAVFCVGRFMHRYFYVWPNESWRFWHYGFGETLSYVKTIDADYKKIYFNNTYEPMLPRFLFYYEYDMNKFQQQFTGDVHIENLEEGLDGFSLGDKYYFGDLKKPVERLAKPDNLVVASGEKDITNPLIFDNPSLKLFKVITSPYMDSIFYVFTGK